MTTVVEQLTGRTVWWGLLWQKSTPITGHDRVRRAWCTSRGLTYEAEFDERPPWICYKDGLAFVEWGLYDSQWAIAHRVAQWYGIESVPGTLL